MQLVLLPGDVFACWGADRTGRAITWRTASLIAPRGLRLGPSHVAMLAEHPRLGTVWVESTTLSRLPCLIRGECVSGCQAHFPEERIAEYRAAGGRVELFRPTTINRFRSDEEDALSAMLLDFVRRGVRYDIGGAMLAGTRIVRRTRLMPAESTDAMFCSELLAAVLMRIGHLNRWNPTYYNPAALLRELVWCGTYARVPEWRLPSDGPQLRIFTGAERAAA